MQPIVGTMNVPHGGLQVLVTRNSRYIHYIGIRCVATPLVWASDNLAIS
jgi:hypothetical protein